MKKILLTFLVTLSLAATGSMVFAAGGGTITQLQVFTQDASGNITQRVGSTPIKITGLSDGCANFTLGILGSTGSACGSGGGSGFSTTSADYFLTQRSTTNLPEGTNLYFTNARADSRFITDLAATTSVKSIITLGSLSLPYSQLTGTPATGVSSVFTRTGAVTAQSGDYNTSQVTENTNLYFTNARAQNAITLTTTGTSGAATYSGGTLNVPQYAGTTYTGTFPVSVGGSVISFGGLSTTTNLTQGQLPYVTGVNTFGQVATTSVTCTGNATCTAFTAIGSSPITINVAAGTAASSTLLSDSNTFSGTLNVFSNPIKIGTLAGLIAGNSGQTYAAGTSTLTASGPLTGSFTQIGSGGALGCTTAASGVAGCLSNTAFDTFNNKQAAISATFPITLSGATVGFGGLSTSSAIAAGAAALYATGVNTVASIATSTPTIGSVLTYSGTLGNVLGGTSGTFGIANAAVTNAMLANSTISGVSLGGTLAALTATDSTLTFSGSYTGTTARTVGLNLGNANTWTGLQAFSNTGTTLFSGPLSTKGWILGTSTTVCLSPNTCQYQATQASSDVAINAAITFVISQGGGTVYIQAGAYTLNAPITIAGDGVTLKGEGNNATMLTLKNSFNDYAIKVNDAALRSRLVFQDFGIAGNRSNQTSGGCIMASSTARSTFNTLWIDSCFGDGIKLSGPAAGGFGYNNTIENSYIANNDIGIETVNNDENQIFANTINSFITYGIWDRQGLLNVHDNVFTGVLYNTGIAIYSYFTQNSQYNNNTFDSVPFESIALLCNTTVQGHHKINGNYFFTSGNSGAGKATIRVDGCVGNQITNNVSDPTTKSPYFYQEVNNASIGTYFNGNVVSATSTAYNYAVTANASTTNWFTSATTTPPSGTYWAQPNATGLLQFNVPTGYSHVFSINGTTAATINSGGILIPSGLSLTNTGVTNGCATWASGVLGSTGTACGSGAGGVTSVATTFPLQTTGSTGAITLSTAFSTTTTWGLGNNGFTITGATGIPFIAASSTLNLPNAALANSTISGVALGGTLFNLSHDATLTGTTYNGSAAVSNLGLDLTHANTWTGLQTFNGNASSTGLTVTGNAYVSGNLDIGTTTPQTKSLFIWANQSGGIVNFQRFNASTNAVLGTQTITAESTGTAVDGFGVGETFGIISDGVNPNTNNTLGTITAFRHGADNSGTLGLFGYGAGSPNAALYLDGLTGIVSIGSSSPSTLLCTQSFCNSNATVAGTADVAGTTNPVVLVTQAAFASLAGIIGTATNHPLAFLTNNTERMRITAAGFLGIGTTTPQFPLSVANATIPQISLTDTTAASAPWYLRGIGSSFYIGTSSPTTFATSSNPAIWIDGTKAASFSVGSSTPTLTATNGMVTLGSNGANGTTTISTGRLQYDTYNSAGTRVCAMIVGTAWSIVTGACTP